MDEHSVELETLYGEIGPQIWTYLRGRIANQAIAEEVFQDTFLAAAENTAALSVALSRRAWLFGIARNLMRERFRRERRSSTVQLPDALPHEEDPVEDPRLDDMKRRIARLPELQREVIELRLGMDLSYAEIAESLAIPIGTVRSRMHHAMSELREWARETARHPR